MAVDPGADHTFTIILGVLGSLGSAATFLALWVKFTSMVNTAQANAKNALQEAVEAKETIKELNNRIDVNHDKIALMNESFGLYRERVAQDYVRHSDLRNIESRLMAAIREASERSTQAINALAQRLDQKMDRNRGS